jgi:F0F1-type ATP synthase membrane subunit c/vacuolar-type H+-ATPase subunit K
MTVIEILLGIAAAYCGFTYAVVYVAALRGMVDQYNAEQNTFHLGLCFIVSLGFLGLLLK